uniref:Chemokine (C-X-C motif) ligand 11, duplicate 8 n=1 Tax=Cyprinus carpio carpio TaxID=630221 RepID=A0A8C1HBJ3_CYPCA
MKQKVTITSVARPWQYKNRVAEIPLFIISSVQTFERLYKIKNKMKMATFIVLICLLVVKVKGHSLDVKGRCICADKGVNKVSLKAIEKVEIIPPSPSCKRMEIVVTMRGAEQKCLNPGSRFTNMQIYLFP